jgi:hypothetical protein
MTINHEYALNYGMCSISCLLGASEDDGLWCTPYGKEISLFSSFSLIKWIYLYKKHIWCLQLHVDGCFNAVLAGRPPHVKRSWLGFPVVYIFYTSVLESREVRYRWEFSGFAHLMIMKDWCQLSSFPRDLW